MTDAVASAPAVRCARCGTELAPSLLACPACRSLVHASTLTRLAAEAEAATAAGDRAMALARWREALPLLPESAPQHAAILDRTMALERELAPSSGTVPKTQSTSFFGRWWALLLAIGIFALTKGKLLLLGLTKTGTLLSMFAFLGVYWAIWGWELALGIVLSIYVHEMGHVAALGRFGIPASAPMFIPGLGAFIRLGHRPKDASQDARIGLAGPLWGLGAALVAWGLAWATGRSVFLPIAQLGALINFLNLAPVWQLDGARAFTALSRPQRWIATVGLVACWYFTRQGALLLVGLIAAWQSFRPAPARADRGALLLLLGIAAGLAWLSDLTVPIPGR